MSAVELPEAGSDRVLRVSMHVLTAALAAVYLFSAATAPARHGAVAAVEAAIGGVELAWVAQVVVCGARRWPYVAGTILQLTLTGLWIVSRTLGLPGVGRLPVGGFDLLCAADALVIAFLSWRCGGERLILAGVARLGFSQLAVMLAVSTVYMSMASMMTMSASAAGRAAWPHGHGAEHFFCHLL